MSARKLFYLGPQGTFTHQAAVNASQALAHLEPEGFELVAADDVPQILDAAQRGEGWGVVAWENNVEGYVVPNLDALIDAKDLVGFARVGVDVTFICACGIQSGRRHRGYRTRAWSRAMQTFHRGTPFGTDSSAIQCCRMSRYQSKRNSFRAKYLR